MNTGYLIDKYGLSSKSTMAEIVEMYNQELQGLGKAQLINGCCVISGIYPEYKPERVLPYDIARKVRIAVGNVFVLSDSTQQALKLWGTDAIPGTEIVDGTAYVLHTPIITARNPKFETKIEGIKLKVAKPMKGIYVWSNYEYYDKPLNVESNGCIIREVERGRSYWDSDCSINSFTVGDYSFRVLIRNVLNLRKSNDYVQVLIPGKLYSTFSPVSVLTNEHNPVSGVVCNHMYDPDVMKYYGVVKSGICRCFAPFQYGDCNNRFAHCATTDEDIYSNIDWKFKGKLTISDLKAIAEMYGTMDGDVLVLPEKWQVLNPDYVAGITYEPHATRISLTAVNPVATGTSLFDKRVPNSLPVCPGLCTTDAHSVACDLDKIDLSKYTKYIAVHDCCYEVRGASATLGVKADKKVYIPKVGYSLEMVRVAMNLKEENVLFYNERVTIFSKHARDRRDLTAQWSFTGDAEEVYRVMDKLTPDGVNLIERDGHRAYTHNHRSVPGHWYICISGGTSFIHGAGAWCDSERRWWYDNADYPN